MSKSPILFRPLARPPEAEAEEEEESGHSLTGPAPFPFHSGAVVSNVKLLFILPRPFGASTRPEAPATQPTIDLEYMYSGKLLERSALVRY